MTAEEDNKADDLSSQSKIHSIRPRIKVIPSEELDSTVKNDYKAIMEHAERVSRIEGTQEGLKQSQTVLVAALGIIGGLLLTAVAVVVALQIFMFQKIDSVEAGLTSQISSIPQRITEEFRAMRTDNAAQTSAIANAITATRQVQPQVLIMPSAQMSPDSRSSSPPKPRGQ